MKRWLLFWACMVCLLLLLLACGRSTSGYTPQTRTFTMVTVPLLVKESATMFGFLKQDFAQGGVLANKEVYMFSPDHLTVYQGDTIQLTIVNPENDAHTFTLPPFNVNVPLAPQAITRVHFVAHKVGVFTFFCTIPTHMPFMVGQLTVLPDAQAVPSD